MKIIVTESNTLYVSCIFQNLSIFFHRTLVFWSFFSFSFRLSFLRTKPRSEIPIGSASTVALLSTSNLITVKLHWHLHAFRPRNDTLLSVPLRKVFGNEREQCVKCVPCRTENFEMKSSKIIWCEIDACQNQFRATWRQRCGAVRVKPCHGNSPLGPIYDVQQRALASMRIASGSSL